MGLLLLLSFWLLPRGDQVGSLVILLFRGNCNFLQINLYHFILESLVHVFVFIFWKNDEKNFNHEMLIHLRLFSTQFYLQSHSVYSLKTTYSTVISN